MKEWKIRVIIFLMTIAVIGLIAVQLYWITNAYNVEEQKFKSAVNDALSSTVKRLEKKETESVVIKKFVDDNGKSDNLIILKDSSASPRIYDMTHSPGKKGSPKYFFKYDANSRIKNDSAITSVNYFDWNGKDTAKEKEEIVTIRKRIDSVFVKKKNNVNQIFYQLMTVEPSKPIMQRVDSKTLNKILSEELTSRGITANYEWGIKVENKDSLLITKASDKYKLTDTEFQVRLFPDDLFGTRNFLLLFFPSQKSYVLRNLYLMLSLSAALIVLIVFLFYRAIILLIRQKKISEIKNDFVNNITHEFKTPISTISLASESIVEPEIINNRESIKRYSKIISEENNRLRGMVENLLNSAVVEKGDFQLKKEKLNIHNIIEELVEKYSVIVEKREGKIVEMLNAENYSVDGDKFHITGIFTNLMDNALKFSKGKPEINISTSNTNDNLIISFTDNGIGIDKQNQNKIFEIFYRVPTGNIHDTKGYGIGLNYVKKMVEAHNGKISVSSKPDKGTTFEITFPISK